MDARVVVRAHRACSRARDSHETTRDRRYTFSPIRSTVARFSSSLARVVVVLISTHPRFKRITARITTHRVAKLLAQSVRELLDARGDLIESHRFFATVALDDVEPSHGASASVSSSCADGGSTTSGDDDDGRAHRGKPNMDRTDAVAGRARARAVTTRDYWWLRREITDGYNERLLMMMTMGRAWRDRDGRTRERGRNGFAPFIPRRPPWESTCARR